MKRDIDHDLADYARRWRAEQTLTMPRQLSGQHLEQLSGRPTPRSPRALAALTAVGVVVVVAVAAVLLAASHSSRKWSVGAPISTRDSLAAFKSAKDASEAARVSALPTRSKVPRTPTAEASDPLPPTGVVSGHQGVGVSDFLVLNRYQVPLNGRFVIVFAGATKNFDGTQGLPAVRIEIISDADDPARGNIISVKDYLAPGITTPLTANGGTATSVSLISSDGHHLTFDLSAMRFT